MTSRQQLASLSEMRVVATACQSARYAPTWCRFDRELGRRQGWGVDGAGRARVSRRVAVIIVV
jgi:hypothetical protein